MRTFGECSSGSSLKWPFWRLCLMASFGCWLTCSVRIGNAAFWESSQTDGISRPNQIYSIRLSPFVLMFSSYSAVFNIFALNFKRGLQILKWAVCLALKAKPFSTRKILLEFDCLDACQQSRMLPFKYKRTFYERRKNFEHGTLIVPHYMGGLVSAGRNRSRTAINPEGVGHCNSDSIRLECPIFLVYHMRSRSS